MFYLLGTITVKWILFSAYYSTIFWWCHPSHRASLVISHVVWSSLFANSPKLRLLYLYIWLLSWHMLRRESSVFLTGEVYKTCIGWCIVNNWRHPKTHQETPHRLAMLRLESSTMSEWLWIFYMMRVQVYSSITEKVLVCFIGEWILFQKNGNEGVKIQFFSWWSYSGLNR